MVNLFGRDPSGEVFNLETYLENLKEKLGKVEGLLFTHTQTANRLLELARQEEKEILEAARRGDTAREIAHKNRFNEIMQQLQVKIKEIEKEAADVEHISKMMLTDEQRVQNDNKKI